MKNLKIILAEDHAVVRHGIKRLIDEQDDMEVVAEASNGQQVLDFLSSGKTADIILSDVNMPELDGFELFNQIRLTHPDIRTVALSMLDSERQIKKCFIAGCLAYLTKSAEPHELIYALRSVGQGKKFLCSESVEKMIPLKYQEVENNGIDSAEFPEFTDREIEILDLIAKGFTNQEIADKIFLSKRTVEGHRQSLIDKSNSRNSAVLVHYAITHNLIT
ncbi:response regulator transcription factor [Pedobacter endophyticus]|uniref:Response regulator transcription factor n=1 Tax=Pedobacter endophyticus TaxID=2789740 RepID=A0A7U3SQQ5_9SPHI|nr:response regulator transcription factor [Pedobacter endophyticus]QPH38591.1 response regulator transcription factor [Pedobacter endophyticus]